MCRVRQGQYNRHHGITRARAAAAGATPAATTETTGHAATTAHPDPEDHTVDPTVGGATPRRLTTTAPPVVTTEAPDLMAAPGALTVAQEDTAVEAVTAAGVIANNR